MSARPEVLSIGVDVGGTFTDVVVLNRRTGEVVHAKAPTTRDDPAKGIFVALGRTGARARFADYFFHGTTLGLNALLERKGVPTGLIATRGFRDVIEIGRMNSPMYELVWKQPEPVVPRRLRKEVVERVLFDGSVLDELDEAEAIAAIDELVASGVESIAVAFLHAYANPDHERAVGALVSERHPSLACSLSSDVANEYREYERSLTTAVDASIKPLLRDYLDEIDARLRAADFAGAFLVTRSDGGVMTSEEAKRRSVRTVLSGPASGVMGAVALGRRLGLDRIITADMGGTSFDASVIVNGEAPIASLADIGHRIRLLMPVIDIATIGAGGGSIARVDEGGALLVGPESAGSDPGPVCYGAGGVRPTFTDAALVSGLLDPGYFLGGAMALHVEAATRAIVEEVARPLGLDVNTAAAGIVALTEATMAATLEEITIGKGHDPRDFTLLAYGGGSPLVATALASTLGIERVIVPPSPGTFSAWGMLTLDIVHDVMQTFVARLEEVEPREIADVLTRLRDEGERALARDGVEPSARRYAFALDLRYDGQEHTLSLAIENDVDRLSASVLRAAFQASHAEAYDYELDAAVELVVCRLRAVGELAKPAPPALIAGEREPSPKGERAALHRASGEKRIWGIYERADLRAGHRLEGPVFVEDASATALVGPGQEVAVDDHGNLVIRVPRPT